MSIHRLARVPSTTIGPGARRQLASLAANLVPSGVPILLAADPGLAETGAIDDVATLLEAGGFPVLLFTDIQSDPTVAQADAAAALARDTGARLLVALGGGSTLDLGKAAAAVAGASVSAQAYALGARPFPERRLNIICVPTTSGTGSETTRTAILSGEDHAKRWLWGEALKSDEVVIDPELTLSLPPALTAATGIDALVHAVEAATNRNASPANDLYAHEAIRLVAQNLERAVHEPANLQAREVLGRAAALAGTAIDNSGTAIAHTIGHALASIRPLHHGRAVGVAMLASLPWTVGNDEDGRFAACAAAMGAKPTATGFIDAYEALIRRVGLKVSLAREFAGVTPEALAAQMVRPENVAMIRSTRRAASDEDLFALAQAVLAQV